MDNTTLERGQAQRKELRRQMAIALAVLVACLVASFILVPDLALAQSQQKDVGFSSIIESLRTLVTVVLLPVGILIAGWRIAYLAVFCAMGGIDPLGLLNGGDGGEVKTSDAVAEIKSHLAGFVKGLAWVGGIWIIFQFALFIAQTLASSLASIS